MDSPADSKFVDYYEVLGVKPSAEINDIRKAYILLAKQHHPDAGGSADKMRELNMAYRTLTSASSKASYDMLHSFHNGSMQPGQYRYLDGREVIDVTDLNDEEIDAFLDSLFVEYRNGPPKQKKSVQTWFKKLFS